MRKKKVVVFKNNFMKTTIFYGILSYFFLGVFMFLKKFPKNRHAWYSLGVMNELNKLNSKLFKLGL